MLKLLKIFVITLILAACGQENDNLSELVIETNNGPITYRVEEAITNEQMAQGLMNRKELKANSGMIFNLGGAKQVSMWMKDTYIALDMLFVDQEGRIVWIYENAKPLSTDKITPETDVALSAVIEINAGDISKNGINVGNLVKHRLIQN